MATVPPHKTPPYASYTSFQNYIEHLRGNALPSRIDKSVMTHLNYGTQQALMATLRCLDLIGDGDGPTTNLELLVEASEEDRKDLLLQAAKFAYPYLWSGKIDLARATSSELHTLLREETGVQGSTIDKVSAFFFGLANDAGITLSPHLTTRKGSSGSSVKRSKPRAKKVKPPEADPQADAKPKGEAGSMADQLLAKFPAFDPDWPDALKEKWFSGFERLMESAEKTGKF